MPKKKKPVIIEEPVVEEEEEVTCPVCGKPVGIDVMSCPHCGAEFEAEEKAPVEAVQEQADDDMAACPVCHKMVSTAVPSCPNCGAEFEAEEGAPAQKARAQEDEEMAACPACHRMVGLSVASCPYCGAEFEAEGEVPVETEAAPVETPKPGVVYVGEEDSAECPVCGKMVNLAVASCPYCGAEFEEEEVEEIIEVEERPAARAATARAPVVEEAAEAEEVEEVEVEEEEPVAVDGPSSITDLRVIGMSLIVLGILGSQIAFMIDWYWTWVPPIGDNLGLFIAIPAIIIVVGLLAFLLVKRAVAGGRKMPKPIPGFTLSMFLTGILVLVMIMLWNPINSALQDSSIGVGAAFVMILVVGAVVLILGMRASARAASE